MSTFTFVSKIIATGIVLGVGFVLPWLWWTVFFGVTSLWLLCRDTSVRRALAAGFGVFFVKSLFAISWFWSTYPIDWIDLSLGKSEPFLVGFYWLTVALFLGLGGLVLGGGWYFVAHRCHFQPLQLVAMALVLVVAEVMSSVFFSIGTFGPGSAVNAVFSFGYSGYLLAEHETLVLFSKVAGVYGLTFLVGIFSWCLWFSLRRQTKTKQYFFSVIMILLCIGTATHEIFLVAEREGDALSVAVIDTNFSGADATETYKRTRVNEAVSLALEMGSQYIILPEDSRYFDTALASETLYRRFRFLAGDTETVVIDSGRMSMGDGAVLRAFVYDGINKKMWTTDKQYLVPQGEYLPYFYSTALAVVGKSNVATILDKKLSYRPGPDRDQGQFSSEIPGVLFCFESADPLGVWRLKSERDIPFVAHPISHAWFHESKILWQQLESMLRVQALWNNVEIVSAGNAARGFLYTRAGKKIHPAPAVSGDGWTVSTVAF